MRRLSLLVVLALTSFLHADALDDRVRAHMQWQRVPGLSLAVMKNGKIVAARGYGLANVESSTPARANTVYRIGSTSKPFLAAGVMMLVDDGKLQLDDPVRQHIADAPASWSAITIRHLLSHTSGLVRDPPAFDPFKPRPDAEVIASAYDVPVRFEAGTKWEYSNTGYYVLAEIIRRVSGGEWTDFIAKRVFAPAAMTTMRPATLAIVPHRARGYETRQGTLQNAEDWLALRPSGAFLSTATDLVKWDAIPLSADSRKAMETPAPAAKRYGLGWFVDTIDGHRHVHHDGAVPGFVAELHRFPDDGLAVAVLANIGNRDLSDLALQIAAMYVPMLLTTPAPAIDDADPRITARLRAFLTSLPAGTFDATLFTEQAASYLREDLQRGIADRLREQGKLRAFTLIERREEDGKRRLRYRASYRHLELFAAFTVDADGKVSAWALTD